LKDGLFIGGIWLGRIATKFGKLIVCFEAGGNNVKRQLIRRTAVFFPNISYHFYVCETKYKCSFKKYHIIINNDGTIIIIVKYICYIL
jgi:hypothetical protein